MSETKKSPELLKFEAKLITHRQGKMDPETTIHEIGTGLEIGSTHTGKEYHVRDPKPKPAKPSAWLKDAECVRPKLPHLVE
jgi:hypothetical protein